MAGDRDPEPVAGLKALLESGIAAVDAGLAVGRTLVHDGDRLAIGNRLLEVGTGVFILAIGKAAAAMARAAEARVGADLRGGLVITKDGHAAAHPTRLACLESGHPVPDARSARAGQAALALAAEVPAEDLLLVLLSGGGSALTTTPVAGLGLDDLAATTRALLGSGVDIEALNTVRKHVSAIAGGKLARARGPGRIEVLCISDVVGDPIDVIASGPCAQDTTRARDALEIVERVSATAPAGRVPEAVLEHLREATARQDRQAEAEGDGGAGRARADGVADDAIADNVIAHHVIARNADARAAIARAAGVRGLRAIDLGEVLRGEARVMANRLVALARSIELDAPVLLIAGGETVVTLRGDGTGGRSQELALAAAVALASRSGEPARPPVTLLAAGTDGSDGPTDAAGACADESTCARAAALGLDPAGALARNDAHGFFARAGGLIRTGPTGTNVMDLVLIQIGRAAAGPS